MYQKILEDLGLSPNEAKIYETLVEKGESSVSTISVSAKIHRRNTYDAIHRLIDKGLCFEIFSAKENKYNAVDPDKLMELVFEKQLQLEKVMPDLKHKFSHRVSSEEAYIYRGYEGLKNVWMDILRIGETVYTLGAKAQWLDPRLESARKMFFSGMNKKDIKHFLLFDEEVRDNVLDYKDRLDFKKEFRFLPKKYSTNSVINIFGDYVVTYTGTSVGKIQDDIVIFVLHSKSLADSYKKWFLYMWDKSPKN